MTEERVYELDARGQGDDWQPPALSRAVNERIAQIAADAGASGPLSILCECADDRCFEQIEIEVSHYAAIRLNPRRFVVKRGHPSAAGEQSVERRDGYVVVERAGETGAESAPRSHLVVARAADDGRRNGALEVEAAPGRQPEIDALLAELDKARVRSEQLEGALRSRIVIEQAKGILAERVGWSIETAFELLRSAARAARMNIHELAHDVVTAESTPGPIINAIARSTRRRRTTSAGT